MQVEQMLNQGLYRMEDYKAGGWVTDLKYDDEIEDLLKQRTGGKEDEVQTVGLRPFCICFLLCPSLLAQSSSSLRLSELCISLSDQSGVLPALFLSYPPPPPGGICQVLISLSGSFGLRCKSMSHLEHFISSTGNSGKLSWR
jgi:hypothetical protein